MFFFEEFDPNLFDLRIRNNHAKLYKVKWQIISQNIN
jgi:hypothetical protein